MADRFFLPEPIGLGPATLEGPEAHHLSQVRRIPAGEQVTLFNGDGREYLAEIMGIGKKRVDLQIIRVDEISREPATPVHVGCAMPKGDRGDFLIEKLTELGATSFTPLMTERSIVKSDDAKIDKLQRAVIEASKQCGRNVLMRVLPAVRFSEWIRNVTGLRWLAHPSGKSPFAPANGQLVTIAIGPEGGFSDREAELAVEAGWELRSLGASILRIETAAIAAVVRATG
ncbi:RsmE family RNA methyltransferase [Zavarzinella formosa]|uniref:RsmE family RNA methyltransferase n=1 Tax=Zavarzinella formosa TaxID=360055 RepID=UPI000310D890|nr:RsmE family RNA methyltransferase [Zavarzinella formosa]